MPGGRAVRPADSRLGPDTDQPDCSGSWHNRGGSRPGLSSRSPRPGGRAVRPADSRLGPRYRRQIVQASGIIGVVLAQDFLLDLQCLAEERFGPRIVALGLIQAGQIVQAVGIIGVVLAQDLLPDFQCLAEERFGPRDSRLGSRYKQRPDCSGCRHNRGGSRPGLSSGSPRPGGRAVRPAHSRLGPDTAWPDCSGWWHNRDGSRPGLSFGSPMPGGKAVRPADSRLGPDTGRPDCPGCVA